MPRSWRARLVDRLTAAAVADPAPLPRYGVALAVSVLAVLFRLATRPYLGDSAPFALFLPAVVVSAGYGGLRAGLLSTAFLAVASMTLFEAPVFSVTLNNPVARVRTAFFALNAVVVSVLADILHQARRRVQRLEHEQVRRDEERAEAVRERARTRDSALAGLGDALRIAEVGDLLIAQGLSGLGAGAGGIALFDRVTGQLVVRRTVGYPADRQPSLRADDGGPVPEALATRRPVAVGSMAEFEERYPHLAEARSRSAVREGLMVAPLVAHDHALGVLYFSFPAPRRFGEEDMALLATLAEHGAPALERAQRYEAERTARLEAEASDARHRLLAEVSSLLASRAELELTLPEVARRLVPGLADACTLHLVDSDGRAGCLAVAHVVASLQEPLQALCETAARGGTTPAVARSLRGDEPARLEEVALWKANAQPGEEAALLGTLGFTGGLSAPLHARGRFLGRLALFTCGSSRPPGGADLDFAVELADRIALPVDNALLLAEARRLNRVKDEFLAMLSHELRTPLGAVLLWTDLLATETLGAGASRAAEMIGRSTRSLAQLIEELLDVSRIVAGKLTIDPHPTLLRELLQQVVDAARPAAAAKGVQLTGSLRGSFPPIWADSNRLRQVFDNVIQNGVKFTPADGEVTVSLEQVEERARIRVRDTGVGMRPELLPVVFERFRQGDSSSTRVQGGLGLGLTIAQHILELHDGRISAWSEGEGRGSTFTIELPLRLPPAAATALSAGSSEDDRPLAGYRVLVVDDHEDTLRGIGVALQGAGAEVRCEGSAREGLDALDSFEPNVIVSDLAMPELDGYGLIRAVRQRPAEEGGSVPAVAVSAYASKEDRQRALAAGFQEHLAKPVDVPRLVQTLCRLTTTASSRSAS
jgi:signal transduction histidine kinase/ActR/RegA family two-component response regulator